MQYACGKSRIQNWAYIIIRNLLTNSMGVEGTASEQDIVKAVTDVDMVPKAQQ